MAILPCLVAYPLIYKNILRKKITPGRITLASITAVVIGLQLGAFGVVIQTLLSGITELPFSAFVIVMQPIHLAIGIVEGIVTAAVLGYVYHNRKNILEQALGQRSNGNTSMKKVYIGFLVATLLVGGIFSWFASAKPDGLEWAIGKVAGESEIGSASELHEAAQNIQNTTALLPDYALAEDATADGKLGTSLSGVVGGAITLACAMAFGALIMIVKKRRVRRY
jgi:cobalt/nickel transport system permease protein